MRTFRVFLSSTFSDLDREREAFRERVVPALHRLCRANGAEFRAVDLRWSISEEAGLDQRTMTICLAEVRRCLAVTPRPNFVVLLGDRYGWRPVPAEIPAPLFERLLPAAGADSTVLLRWYMRDDNAIPPACYLRPRDDEYRAIERWRAAERDLLRVLENAAQSLNDLSYSERLLFGASATEQEIQYGALSSDPTDRVFCYFRHIHGGLPPEAAPRYFDSLEADRDTGRARLETLKQRLRSAFGGRVREYDARWQPQGLTSDHIDAFCRDVQANLETVIARELAGPAYADALQRERDEHAAFAQGRSRIFVGRKDLLDAIESHTVSSSRSPFALIGASGTGKSALMARAAADAVQRHAESVVVCRFAGVTPQSSDVASLLGSLCRDLSSAYGRTEDAVPHSYEELVKAFRTRLGYAYARKPLIVLVDALDQLADVSARTSLAWIPADLPPYVRLMISALPVLQDAIARVVEAQHITTLRPLDSEECSAIVTELLRDARRDLQTAQRSAVDVRSNGSGIPLYIRLLVEQVRHWCSGDGVPRFGSDVPSLLSDLFDDLSDPANHGRPLVSSTLGLLAAARNGLSEDELLDTLSADARVLEDFRTRSVHSWASTVLPPIVWARLQEDLEPYLTTRGADGASLVGFFHRQFRERVEELYLEPARISLHRHLATYFAGQQLYLDDQREVPNLRKLSELSYQQVHGELARETQQLLVDPVYLEAKIRATGPQSVVDDCDRALSAACCTNADALEHIRDALRARAHVLRGDPGQLHSQLTGRLSGASDPELVQFLETLRQHAAARRWLRPLTRSLGLSGDAFIRILGTHEAVIWQVVVSPSGRFAASAGNDRDCVIWDLENSVELHRLNHREPVFAAAISADDRHVACAAAATLTLWDLPRGIQLRTEQSAVGWIRTLALTHDGRLAVFGSDEGVIGTWDLETGAVNPRIQTFPIARLTVLPDDTVVAGRQARFGDPGADSASPTLEAWNLGTGQLIRRFGTGGGINSVALVPNTRRVVVATDKGSVQLWNVDEGALERSFTYSGWWADGATITPNGGHVIAGGGDHYLRVWDASTQEMVATLKGHHNVVRTTAALPDGNRFLSGSDDQSVRLWDLRRSRKPSIDTAHEAKVHALCQSPDGPWVVSASEDMTVKFWDPREGRCAHSLTGHSSAVWSAAFTPDGRTLLALQNGATTVVWDVESRKQRQVLRLVPRATAFANRVVPCADNRHFFCGGEMFEIETGKVVYQLPEYETGVVAALPDGEHIIFHGNGTPLCVWSLKTDTELARFPGFKRAAILDDTRLMTTGAELALWDMRDWNRLQTIAAVPRGDEIAARADLGIIATASRDYDVRVWTLTTGQFLAAFTAESPLTCCVMSTSEPVIVVGDELGNLHFLRLEGFDS